MEVSSEEFHLEQQKKMHEKLITAIGNLSSAVHSIDLSKPNDNSDLITKLDYTLKMFNKKLEDFNPTIKVEKTEEKFPKEIVDLFKMINKGIGDLNKEEVKETKEWEFIVNRNNYGFITSVTAKSK